MDDDLEREIIQELHRITDIYEKCMAALREAQENQTFQKLDEKGK